MQDFFRCQERFEDRATLVAIKVYKKLMKDMHYEARIQAVITDNMTFLGRKVTKADARSVMLTRQQYLEVNIEY
jgi:protein associated with RNAse G/E